MRSEVEETELLDTATATVTKFCPETNENCIKYYTVTKNQCCHKTFFKNVNWQHWKCTTCPSELANGLQFLLLFSSTWNELTSMNNFANSTKKIHFCNLGVIFGKIPFFKTKIFVKMTREKKSWWLNLGRAHDLLVLKWVEKKNGTFT